MAWIYLAVSEDSHWPWDHTYAQSPTVNQMDMHSPSFCRECGMSDYHSRPYGTMCELCTVDMFRESRTLFTAVSRARTSALQEMVRAWKASEADYFSRYAGSSTKSNRRSSSWKTSRPLGPVAENEWGKNWPSEGMIVDGQCYPLRTLGRPISESVGSYWPTATATDSKSSRNATVRNRKVAGHSGVTLTDFVTLFPTPSASSYGTNKGGAAGRTGKARPSLETLARTVWSTPRASDGSKGGPNMKFGNNSTLPLPAQVGGQLNPTWVEWLMGYPLEWTALEDWAMQWFRSKRGRRSKS